MDLINRQDAIDICINAIDLWNGQIGCGALIAVKDKIADLPSAQQWIPVEWHTITDEEREYYSEECVYCFDCAMPDEEQEILITVKYPNGRLLVEKDICYISDGYELDSGYDWIDDVVAWMPLLKPYKAPAPERDCEHCVHHTDKGCSSWDCEFERRTT